MAPILAPFQQTAIIVTGYTDNPLLAGRRQPVRGQNRSGVDVPPLAEIVVDKGLQQKTVVGVAGAARSRGSGKRPDIVDERAVDPGAIDPQRHRGRAGAPYV